MSCASAGDCSAGGTYDELAGNQQAFVVSQTDGIWGAAEEVPGSGDLNEGGDASVTTVSCATAGNCSAGGSCEDSAGSQQAFVVSQTGGVWGAAQEVPGAPALDPGGNASVVSVSTADRCSAVGGYADSAGGHHPFTVRKT